MSDYIPIPGAAETIASQVTQHSSMGTTEKHLNVFEKCTQEDESEDEEDTYSQNTPSLMEEISATLDTMSRTEPTVFTVDESNDTVEYEGPEHIQQVEDVTDDDTEPPLEIDLTEGDAIVLNEDVRL